MDCLGGIIAMNHTIGKEISSKYRIIQFNGEGEIIVMYKFLIKSLILRLRFDQENFSSINKRVLISISSKSIRLTESHE